MVECIVDSREKCLYDEMAAGMPFPVKSEMLPVGDVLLRSDAEGVLLLVERKTVMDLIKSLHDGRHHDQRNRWIEFREGSPNTTISLWVEGDLMGVEMDEKLRSALLNSLFRAQSIDRIVVHQVRSRRAFLESIRVVADKLAKEPMHLLQRRSPRVAAPMLDRYKKSAHSRETYWRDCLALITGVSCHAANSIVTLFPTPKSLLCRLAEDRMAVLGQLAGLQVHPKRKLGSRLAETIVEHFGD